MLNGLPGVDPVRRAKLMEVLDINPDWRMHTVSDGQRRRVQICLGLLKPFDVLLLDEITVDLDVLGRADLMQFLKGECEQRGATIVYVRDNSRFVCTRMLLSSCLRELLPDNSATCVRPEILCLM